MATEATTIRPHCEPVSPSSVAKARPLSLRCNFSWTLVGNVVHAGCQWGILVAAVRFGDKAIAGQLILALAITTPIVLFFQMQLRTVLGTDIRSEYSLSQYLTFRLITIFLATSIACMIACSGYFSDQAMWAIILISLAKGVESFSDICYGWFQRNQRMNQVAKSMITRGLLALIAFVVVFWWTKSLVLGILGMLLAKLTVCLLYDLPGMLLLANRIGVSLHKTSSQEPRFPARKPLAVYRSLYWKALPLGLMWFFASLNTNIPNYLVERFCGETSLGIFGCIAYFMVAGSLAMNAITASASPKLAKYYSDNNLKSYVSLLKKLVVMALSIGIATILITALLGKTILIVAYGEEYSQYSQMLTLLMAAGTIRFVASPLGAGITATRKFHLFTPFYFVSCLIVLGFAWLLIPSMGIWGAVWTSCIAAILFCLSPALILFVIWRSHHGRVAESTS